jgi:hypothetical protein
MAGAFGLVHGMAFSAVIGRQLIDPWVKFQAVLAFNFGVETVQLVLVTCAAPLLIFFASNRWYHLGRTVSAFAIGLIAAGWMVQRLELLGTASGLAKSVMLTGFVAIPAVAAVALLFAMSLGQRAKTLAFEPCP